ncbi:MAG: phospholipase D-like domain-containing protein, partial [Candidatus Ratteibacteria bacterium]|nr:phospholipase D-like domain-containing protein [Candidatus Ratteibacteria bacterium]
MKKLVIFFFILLQPTFSSNIPTLYFTPNRQTDKIVISIIEGAESSLYIAGYSVSWENILKLIKKKQESVEVKVLVDGQIKGVPEDIVRVYKKPGFFHPKFITVDEKTVLIGSGNFTEDGFHLHHNHFLLIQDRDIADFFNRRFLAWWDDISEESQKVKLKGQKTKGENQKLEIYQDGIYRIYFSPETDCESVIIQEISKARDTIHFAHYRFTSESITKAIILRKMAGVNVYGIMDASGIAPYSVFYPLSDYGC